MKSAVTRKGTQSEEERRAKKEKAETIIQSVKEQEEPTQAVLIRNNPIKSKFLKNPLERIIPQI
jgi:hypothetical protein